MKSVYKDRMLYLILIFSFFLLILCACSITLNREAAESHHENNLALTAKFQRNDGTALSGASACARTTKQADTILLDAQGQATFSRIPRDGELMLALVDGSGTELSQISLQFTTSAVTDASTDAEGVGHISVKEDTEQLTLLFILDENNRLQCELCLNEVQR